MNYVLDTEYLTWSNKSNYDDRLRKKWQKKEIIQVGICRVIEKKNKLLIKKKLNIYIKPKFNPIIPKRIIKLTKITQNIIEKKGIPYTQGVKKIEKFLDAKPIILANGDEKKLFKYNHKLNNIKFNSKIKKSKFINLKTYLNQKYGKKKYNTEDLSKIFKFRSKKLHNALFDCLTLIKCVNIALKKNNVCTIYKN